MSPHDTPPLDSAVTAVVASANLEGICTEYLEVGVDALMQDGLLKDIPFVGTVVALVRAGGAIRDRMFLKKLLEFLGPLSSTTATERAELVGKLESDKEYGRKVGEHLIDLIDRIDSHKKPAMIGRIFLAYMRRDIDALLLHRLIHAVETLPGFEIPMVRGFLEGKPRSPGPLSLQNLVKAGFVETRFEPGGRGISHVRTIVADYFVAFDLDV